MQGESLDPQPFEVNFDPIRAVTAMTHARYDQRGAAANAAADAGHKAPALRGVGVVARATRSYAGERAF